MTSQTHDVIFDATTIRPAQFIGKICGDFVMD